MGGDEQEKVTDMDRCPCGSGRGFEDCCGPILGGAPAPTAEALMRSRYTAYVRDQVDHIERTHASSANEDFDRAATEELAHSVDWLGLDILSTSDGLESDETGTVEFAVRYRQNREMTVHHELSYFGREDGRWVYVDGTINPKGPPRRVEKVGRNDPCPCGSGKKYKKCCGA